MALAFAFPTVLAQSGTCETNDINDSGTDHTSTTLDPVTSLDEIDMTTGCVAENDTSFQIVINTVSAPGEGVGETLVFRFHFTTSNVSYTVSYDFSQTTSQPGLEGASVVVSGSSLTMSVPRTSVNRTVSDIFIESQGTFVTGTQVTQATDRAPDGDATIFPSTAPYRVGSRAPPNLDSDGDGETDRNEIAAGTDPHSLDSDFDGLLDGATVEVETGSEAAANYTSAGILVLRDDGTLVQFAGERQFGTNASNPDTDGDGLLDGGNVTAAAGSDAATTFEQFGVSPYQGGDVFLGEFGFGSDPRTLDSDEDGIDDYAEVTGSEAIHRQSAFFPGFDGSTNPNDEDTDADGLTDGEEREGSARINNEETTFLPTDPNGPDTDHDGLTDYDELRGSQTNADGTETTFPPTDPTLPDSDGDTFDDGLEVAAGTDPRDPDSVPGDSGEGTPGQAEASYLWLSTVAMLVVGLLCVVGIMVRWG